MKNNTGTYYPKCTAFFAYLQWQSWIGMAMQFRTPHKMETGPVMEMMEKSLRITTEYCLGYIFISDEHIVESPFTPLIAH